MPQTAQQPTSAEHAHEAVRAFSRWVNDMAHDNSDFVQAVMAEHRTLQQQMFEVMIACMAAWAKQEHYDQRCEFTVLKCREIMEHFPGGARVPFI